MDQDTNLAKDWFGKFCVVSGSLTTRKPHIERINAAKLTAWKNFEKHIKDNEEFKEFIKHDYFLTVYSPVMNGDHRFELFRFRLVRMDDNHPQQESSVYVLVVADFICVGISKLSERGEEPGWVWFEDPANWKLLTI